MPSVADLAVWEGLALLAGFIAVVLWKLMTGDISLDYLLYGDARTSQGSYLFFSSGRAQMLMVTIALAGYCLLEVIQNPTKFPDVPNAMLAVLGSSHAIYLGGKAQAMYLGRLRDLAALVNGRRP